MIDTGKVSADVMNAAVGHLGLVNSEDFAMIRLLVERGANINVATDLSKEVINPLVNAIMHCDANMVRLLVELGADVNLKDRTKPLCPWPRVRAANPCPRRLTQTSGRFATS